MNNEYIIVATNQILNEPVAAGALLVNVVLLLLVIRLSLTLRRLRLAVEQCEGNVKILTEAEDQRRSTDVRERLEAAQPRG